MEQKLLIFGESDTGDWQYFHKMGGKSLDKKDQWW